MSDRLPTLERRLAALIRAYQDVVTRSRDLYTGRINAAARDHLNVLREQIRRLIKQTGTPHDTVHGRRR